MGRLIDADKLKEALHEDCMTAMGTIDESALELFMIEIDEIPTAYDVDKVVEQLEETREELLHSTDYDNDMVNYCLDWFDKAIEIVKGGGQAIDWGNEDE